jgi:hypothetical protein
MLIVAGVAAAAVLIVASAYVRATHRAWTRRR